MILTDNGYESQNPDELEISQTGEKRTAIYDCDPYRSNQKGALEKNHEYIRYVRSKGTSFEDLDDKLHKIKEAYNTHQIYLLN